MNKELQTVYVEVCIKEKLPPIMKLVPVETNAGRIRVSSRDAEKKWDNYNFPLPDEKPVKWLEKKSGYFFTSEELEKFMD